MQISLWAFVSDQCWGLERPAPLSYSNAPDIGAHDVAPSGYHSVNPGIVTTH